MTARELLDGIKTQLAEVTNLGEWETTRANDVVIYAPNGFGAYKLIAHADAKWDADFIAAAPVTVARLTAALEAVLAQLDEADEDRRIIQDSKPTARIADAMVDVGDLRAAIEKALTD